MPNILDYFAWSFLPLPSPPFLRFLRRLKARMCLLQLLRELKSQLRISPLAYAKVRS